MKKLFIAVSMSVFMVATACHDRSNTHDMTTTPLADTAGSDAKMTDSPGHSRPDTTIGDNTAIPGPVTMKKK